VNEPDYLELWHNLVERGGSNFAAAFNQKEKAEAYEAASSRKNMGKPDTLIEIVKNEMKPEDTVIDVGAGTGRWTIPLAKIAARVTAVDPSEAMLDILKKHAAEQDLTHNIDLANCIWEQAEVDMADFVISFHAIYLSADFRGFVRKMEAHSRKRCYLGLRHFPNEGIIQELSKEIHGNPYDSPNFIIGYNALFQMGIYANVTIEKLKHNWKDDTMESAFHRAKRHLHLENDRTHDALIYNVLGRRLSLKEGIYHWPDCMSTALVWWDTQPGNINT
jgi:SAM-dependent methyltransferase